MINVSNSIFDTAIIRNNSWFIEFNNFSNGDLVTQYAENEVISSVGSVTPILIFILITAASRLLIVRRRKGFPIPGPRRFPIVGNALSLIGDSSHLLKRICSFLDEYDGLVGLYIGPKLHVFVSRPDYLQTVFLHPHLQKKSQHYEYAKPALGESIFTSNGAVWKEGRKLLLPALRPSLLKSMMPNFNENAKTLIQVISKEVDKPSFDVLPYIQNCTYSMIFESVMGRPINCQTKRLKVLDVSEKLMDLMYERTLKLWLQWDALYFLLPQGKIFKNAVDYVTDFNMQQICTTIELINSGQIDADNGRVLVDSILRKMGPDVDMKVLKDHILTMLVTGYDTTAGTLGFVLMMLGIHQEVQEKVYREGQKLKSRLNGRDVMSEDLNELEYLEMVIKETLRLFPVGPLLFREATEDVKIGEVIVPRGATVACVMIHTHRDSQNFPEPLRFNPDNFLPDRVATRHLHSYTPFSAGSRGCIGVKYGLMSMKTIISELVANYRIFCDLTMEQIKIKPEITLKIQGGYRIRIEKRV